MFMNDAGSGSGVVELHGVVFKASEIPTLSMYACLQPCMMPHLRVCVNRLLV